MNIIYYIFHRTYNALRGLTHPSIGRYRKFKQVSKDKNKRFWKEKQYPLVDK